MRIIYGVILTVVVMLLGGLLFLYSGAYNIAAAEAEGPVTHWAFSTLSDNSIASQAADVEVPDLSGHDMVDRGFQHFRGMCVQCHGAPGVEPSAVGKGLNPAPPDLPHAAEEMSSAELFWIAKHGIKMTGMPAFGATHSDEDLWAVVAFLEKLPDMDATAYREYQASHGGDSHGHGHEGGEHAADSEEGHSHGQDGHSH